MNKILKSVITLSATTALVGAGVGTALATSSSSSLRACTLRADTPNSGNDAAVGRVGCSNTISGEGFIFEDRSGFPDGQVGYKRFAAGVSVVHGGCGNGYGSYYSEFDSSSGATIQSSRVMNC